MTRDTTALLLTDDAPLQLGYFRLDSTGLAVTGSPPYDEWEKCGAFLQQIDGAVQWWIGDWLNYGEHAYGKKYSQALDATGIELRTLEAYAYVAANVDTTIRIVGEVAHNYGNYVSVRHEFLLICTRGSCTPDAPVPMPNSVVTERRSETHSEKPESFRTTIERLYPLGRRLEGPSASIREGSTSRLTSRHHCLRTERRNHGTGCQSPLGVQRLRSERAMESQREHI